MMSATTTIYILIYIIVLLHVYIHPTKGILLRNTKNIINQNVVFRPNHDYDDEPDSKSTFTLQRRRTILHQIITSLCSTSIITGSLYNPSCSAISIHDVEQSYDSYANTYDQLDGGMIATSILGINDARYDMIQRAYGNVLEIGVGTGLNLEWYNQINHINPQQQQHRRVTSLTLVDISENMLQQAQMKVQTLPNLQGIPITFVKADMTSQLVSKFPNTIFDTVIDSFSMCVLGDDRAIQCFDQIQRIVHTEHDGGQILLLENSRSSNPVLGTYQDMTANTAATMGGKGCIYNQNIEQLIAKNHHLRIVETKEYTMGLFRFFRCVRV